MVAEYVARQGGSPVNGETPTMATNGVGRGAGSGPGLYGGPPPPPPQPQQQQGQQGQQGGSQSRAQSPDTNSYPQRKQREFIPDNKKDESYWDRRRRNNEAAKRSREKRRFNDMILEQRVIELTKENHVLKAQLTAIRDRYGISGDSLLSMEHVLATLPSNDQMLGQAKRPKLTGGVAASGVAAPPPPPASPPLCPSAGPVPTSVIHQPVSGMRSPPPQPMYDDQPPPPSHYYLSSHQEPEYPCLYDCPTAAALNLSRGCRSDASTSERAASPYELSAGSGDEAVPSCHPAGPGAGANNCLPHKLRHKSHLGEKEAAGALLSLQAIKTEASRASPPWDGEGSSDERDSGISLGVEWTGPSAAESTPAPAPAPAPSSASASSLASAPAPPTPTPPPSITPVITPVPHGGGAPSAPPSIGLEGRLAHLASEVATLKSFMMNKATPLPLPLPLPVQLALPRQMQLTSMPPLPPLQQPHVALM